MLDAAPNLVRSGDAVALASFRETAPCHRWITFYFAAEHLIASGQGEEAVRWFYVGQIRGRTVAALDSASTPMLIDALQYLVGQPVNEYAGADLAKWIEAVDWAIDWDRRNPMTRQSMRTMGPSLDFDQSKPLHLEHLSPPVSQARFDAAYAEQRRGVASLREALSRQNPEEWARQRRANGLN